MKNIIKSLFLCIIIIASVNNSFAQLNGTYTIGGAGATYPTISSAAAALAVGVSGPVVFNINQGTYTEKFYLGAITGVNATNTVTFKSTLNDSSLVIITDASSTTSINNYTVGFIGTSYVTFKGVTIQRTGTNNYSQVVSIASLSHHIKILNCRLIGPSTTTSATYRSIIYGANQNSNANSNIELQNNVIENGSIGVSLSGFGSTQNYLDNGTIINGNHFINQYYSAVRLSYQVSPEINKNTINSSSTSSSFRGIYAFYCDGGLRIMKNKFSLTNGIAVYLSNSDAASGQKGLIANNFISNVNGSGVYITNSLGHNVYYNSINITGTNSVSSTLYFDGTVVSDIAVFNNNFINNLGYTIYVTSTTVNPITTSDYNNLYTTGTNTAYWKTTGNIASLAAWKTASGKDAHSISVTPQFNSATDLHTLNGLLDKAGTASLYTPLVTDDIDGEARGLQPDIGADQFNIDDLEMVCGFTSDTMYCENEIDSVWVMITNKCVSPYTGSITAFFEISPFQFTSETMTISNLMHGDTILKYFSTKIIFDTIGDFESYYGLYISNDIDHSNDTANHIFNSKYHVYTNPTVNLGSDTTLCAGNSIVLDAGAGNTSYFWSDSTTNQTLTVDTAGIGINAAFVYVIVGNHNTCFDTDTIKITFIDCTGIDEVLDDELINVYPNPTSGLIYLNLSNVKTKINEVKILNQSGGIVFKMNDNSLNKNLQIDISTFSKGLYFIQLSTANGNLMKKIILE